MWRYRLSWVFIVVILALEGCGGPSATPTAAPWAPRARITLPTMQDYFHTARLDQTEQIWFYDGQTKQDHTISDPASIQAMLQLLLNGPAPATPGTPIPVREISFDLRMELGPRERIVSVSYSPEQNMVWLGNNAMTYWPDLLYGTYPVAPGFGPALFRILQLDGGRGPG